MNTYLAENIRRLRREKGITQEELATLLGVSGKTVSHWECGDTMPDITLLIPLSSVLGSSIDTLIGNDKIVIDERITRIVKEYERLDAELPVEETIPAKNKLAFDAYHEYPNDWRIINIYIHSMFCGYDDDRDVNELRRLCELTLEECAVQSFRLTALHAMLSIADNNSDAERLLESFPNDANQWRGFARAVYLRRTEQWEQLRDQQRHNVADALNLLSWMLSETMCSYPDFPVETEQFLKIRQTIRDIYSAVEKCESAYPAENRTRYRELAISAFG